MRPLKRILLLCCLLPLLVEAQPLDSLEAVLHQASTVEQKRDLWNQLITAYHRMGAWEKAEVLIKKRLTLRTTQDSVVAFSQLGTAQAMQQQFGAALPFYQQSWKLANNIQDYQGASRAALNVGNIHLIEGNWATAINHYVKSGALKEKLGDEAGLAILHNNIASIYKDQKRYQESLEYFEKSRAYYEQAQDSVELAKAWVNIAVVKILKREFQAGIDLLAAALPIIKAAEEEAILLILQLNMAFVYSEVGKYQLALNYLKLATQKAEIQQDWYALTTIRNLYGGCYFYIEQYDKAIVFYSKALRLGQELELLSEQKIALFGLYETEQAQKNYQASLQWLEQYNVLKDSLEGLQTNRQLVELQEKYDAQQKEQEIARLSIINENIELESQLKSKQINLLISGGLWVLLVMGLLSVFVYYRHRQQKIVLEHAQALHKERVNQLMDKQALATLDAVFQAQQKERKSLAKDIHDNLGSFLATLKYQHEAGAKQGEEQQYKIMEGLIEQAYEEVRSISHQMATGEGFNFNLMAAVNALVARVKKTQQFEIEFQCFGEASSLSQDRELLLYRIIQELFSNILKHAEATQATLQINKGEQEWLVLVEDNGKGFDAPKLLNSGLGLASIQERVQDIQGQLEIDTYQGRGTTVVLTVPTELLD